MRTTFCFENEGLLDSRTDSAQISKELTTPKIPFRNRIRHQMTGVTNCGKKQNNPIYRIIYRADGKRRMQHFAKHSDALKVAEAKLEQLWKAHPIIALSAAQTRAAILLAKVGRVIRWNLPCHKMPMERSRLHFFTRATRRT